MEGQRRQTFHSIMLVVVGSAPTGRFQRVQAGIRRLVLPD